MKTLILCLFTFTLSLALPIFGESEVYADYDESYQENDILHEMFLACVTSKAECTTMAHHEGFNTSKVIKDRARCPQRPKTLACIVKH